MIPIGEGDQQGRKETYKKSRKDIKKEKETNGEERKLISEVERIPRGVRRQSTRQVQVQDV